MNLENVATGALEAELKRRKEKKRLEFEADRKAREVKVYCPQCNGSKVRPTNADPLKIACGEVDPTVSCPLCNGLGIIVAYKV